MHSMILAIALALTPALFRARSALFPGLARRKYATPADGMAAVAAGDELPE